MSCVLAINATGQNLVPNPGFESYKTCPQNLTGTKAIFTSRIDNWECITGGTSDYFNSCCSTGAQADVPKNLFGTQLPAQGQGYVGLYTYAGNNYREYIGVTIPPLDTSVTYEVSMSVSLADTCKFATNGIGVLFYNKANFDTINYSLIPNTAQILFPDTVKEKTNWVRLHQTFKPDSSYTRMGIGCFKSNLAVINVSTPTTMINGAYYFIDSVVVAPITSDVAISPSYLDSVFCPGDTFYLPYKVIGAYAPTNVFTAQLSAGNGLFTNPTSIGTITKGTADSIRCIIPHSIGPGQQYKIRIMATAPLDSSAATTFSIDILQAPLNVTATAAGICEGDTLKLFGSATGTALNYTWNGPLSFLSSKPNDTIYNAGVAASGNYVLTVRNGNCTVRDTATVTITSIPPKPSATSNSPVCAGETLQLGVNNPSLIITYLWSGPDNFKDTGVTGVLTPTKISSTGNYILSASDGNCSIEDTIWVTVNPAPSPIATANTPLCEGEDLWLTLNTQLPGTTYKWQGPSNFSSIFKDVLITGANFLNNGNYTITATLGNCSVADTISVVIKPTPAPPAAMAPPVLCVGDTLFLDVINPDSNATYTWTGPVGYTAHTRKALLANMGSFNNGAYIVYAMRDGCASVKDTVHIIATPRPDIPEVSSNHPVCDGAQLLLSAISPTPGVTYTWSGPFSFTSQLQEPVIDPVLKIHSGTYIAMAVLNGCKSLPAYIDIDVKPSPLASIQFKEDVCANSAEELRIYYDLNNMGYDWQWDGGIITDSSNNIYYLMWTTAGEKYLTLTVTGKNGCTTTRKHAVSVHPEPQQKIEFISNNNICTNDTIQLSTTYIDSLSYEWLPVKHFPAGNKSNTVIAQVPYTGFIWLHSTNNWGCKNTDSIFIDTRPCCNVALPTAFTPNADGKNDKFRIITEGNHEVITFIIVNRWGQEIFKTIHEEEGWNGTFKGRPQEVGAYYYYLKYKCSTSEVLEKKGEFMLIR